MNKSTQTSRKPCLSQHEKSSTDLLKQGLNISHSVSSLNGSSQQTFKVPEEQEFRIKSHIMESELQSLRSKIDELEVKLGKNTTANSSIQTLSQVSSQCQLLGGAKRLTEQPGLSYRSILDQQYMGKLEEVLDPIDEYGCTGPALKLEDLPKQLSSSQLSQKSRSRVQQPLNAKTTNYQKREEQFSSTKNLANTQDIKQNLQFDSSSVKQGRNNYTTRNLNKENDYGESINIDIKTENHTLKKGNNTLQKQVRELRAAVARERESRSRSKSQKPAKKIVVKGKLRTSTSPSTNTHRTSNATTQRKVKKPQPKKPITVAKSRQRTRSPSVESKPIKKTENKIDEVLKELQSLKLLVVQQEATIQAQKKMIRKQGKEIENLKQSECAKSATQKSNV